VRVNDQRSRISAVGRPRRAHPRSPTNRVLAHKRIVAGFWIVLIAIPVSQLAVLGLTAIADVWFYGTGATAWMVADEKIAS
jgi:hypothetical protein